MNINSHANRKPRTATAPARRALSLLLLGCFLLGYNKPVPAGMEPAGIEEVQACMNGNIPATVQLKQLQLQYVDRVGQASSYELEIYARHGQGEFEASVMVTQPRKLAGAAYLLQSSTESYQIYMYAPSLGKVRRVSGDGLVKSSLLGSDLSWEDLQIIYSAFREGSMRLVGQGELQGRTVHNLELTPDPNSASAYSRIHLAVDQQSCVPLEIKLMQQGDVLRKRFTAQANSLVKVADKYWYAAKGQLEDALEGTHTRLEVLQQIEADERLSTRFFNSKTFYQGR